MPAIVNYPGAILVHGVIQQTILWPRMGEKNVAFEHELVHVGQLVNES